MLLEGAIKFARQGQEGLLRKDFEAMFNGVSQARSIVLELMTSMRADVDPKIAEQVKSVYSFMYKHLLEASFEKDAEKVGDVVDLLEYERETWVMLMQKVAQERAAGGGRAPDSAPANEPAARAAFSAQG